MASHRGRDVVEERLVAGAQVVEPGLAVGRRREAVLGAATVAREADVALEAVARQRVALVQPELALLIRGDELEHGQLADVAEPEPRLDEVVARVDVAVVLHDELRGRTSPRGRRWPPGSPTQLASAVSNICT